MDVGTAVADAEEALRRADDAFTSGDVDGMLAHLSAAIRSFTAAGDNRRGPRRRSPRRRPP